VNGIRYGDKDLKFSKNKNSIISYYITDKDEKLHFKFTIGKSEIPELILYEASYDLIENPELRVKQRPSDIIAMPFVLTDQIITVKKLSF
jgi:hypothetical protein